MDVVVRASVIYFVIFLVIRGLGRRELAEMSPFELIVLVVMGDLIQQGVTQEDYSITGALVAVGTMALWSLALSFIGARTKKTRDLIQGMPAIVYRNGEPLVEVLRLQRLDLQDLLDEARQQGIASLREVEYAVLEPSGKFSFVKTEGSASPPPEQGHRSVD